jgi:RNA polymerase sigma-70 factor (ECF subfamily)
VTSSALDRARGGSERAFDELVQPYRRELHLHCYRMLGSVADAEDLLQETLLAAWRGLGGFAGRSSLRTWLYRIATNRCLNALRDNGRRAPAEPVPPFAPPEPSRRTHVTWLQPYPDALLREVPEPSPGPAARYLARETVELAFVAALQELPPRQVAALLLCDVLGYSLAEVAQMLGTTAGAVKGARQRARAAVAEQRGSRGASRLAPAQEWDLARRFGRAFADDDVHALVELLTDDAWLAMPPAPHEYQGRDAIAAFWRSSAVARAGRTFRLALTRANGQPAFACYLADDDGQVRFTGVVVLTLTEGGIRGVTRFLDADLAHPFGLSRSLEPSTVGGPPKQELPPGVPLPAPST